MLPATVRRPRWRGGRRASQSALLAAFGLLALAYAPASGLAGEYVPLSSAILLAMAAAYVLRLRALLRFYAVLAPAVLLAAVLRGDGVPVGGLVLIAVSGVLVAGFVRSREALGVQGTEGAAMLVDLRDRLRAQAGPPPLPRGWRLQSALRSANGAAFSGDFVLAGRRPLEADDPGLLEVVLVDVSGKGQPAGTRALLLAGALGGLLGATATAGFLPAANAYLLRQDWGEGFATAVHATVDPGTGRYAVRSAGHPPVLHYIAGPGRWRVLPQTGNPALGLLPGAAFAETTGVLDRGDALVLYSDGLVESRGRDLTFGIDRMSGALARLQRRGFRRAAEQLVDQEWVNPDDDRTVVIVSRH